MVMDANNDIISGNNTSEMQPPAIFIERMGEYHRARVEAIHRIMPEIVVVETCGDDETYLWDKVRLDQSITRLTLFQTAAQSKRIGRLYSVISEVLSRHNVGCVVVPGYSDAAAICAMCWAYRFQKPIVLMSDSQQEDKLRNPCLELLKRMMLSNVGAALVAGDSHAQYLSTLGIPRENIFLGYDVVDNAYFSNHAEISRSSPSLRSELGLPSKYFLSISRFVKKKNLIALIAAYREYRHLVDDPIDLVLVGDGPLREVLLENSGDGLTIRPFAQYGELPILYGLAEGFILASTSEQWGLTVNEAMASGCVVLGSDRAGAVRELVSDGETGLKTGVSINELRDSLVRLHYADRKLLASKARVEIGRWSPDMFAENLKKALDVAADKGPQTPLSNRLGYLMLNLVLALKFFRA